MEQRFISYGSRKEKKIKIVLISTYLIMLIALIAILAWWQRFNVHETFIVEIWSQ